MKQNILSYSGTKFSPITKHLEFLLAKDLISYNIQEQGKEEEVTEIAYGKIINVLCLFGTMKAIVHENCFS